MKNLIAPLLLLIGITTYAQTLSPHIESSSGDFFTNSQGSMSWTLGEVMVETYSQPKGFLTQGFHQPLTISITNVEEEENGISTYPNPVRDLLHVKITPSGDYQIALYSLQGIKLVDVKTTMGDQEDEHVIDMKEYAATLYLLQITDLSTGKNIGRRILKF